MARGKWSDGRRDVLISPINQPPRSLVCNLLRFSHLTGQGPLPRPLHSEGEGRVVPPPGRVLLRQVPGHGVGLHIASDLLLMSIYPRVAIEKN